MNQRNGTEPAGVWRAALTSRTLRCALALMVASAAAGAWAQPRAAGHAAIAAPSPEAALACAAARFQGEALAMQWLAREQLWEVRWLTPARAVLRIRLGPGCHFDEVQGVGQEAALRPPRGGAR